MSGRRAKAVRRAARESTTTEVGLVGAIANVRGVRRRHILRARGQQRRPQAIRILPARMDRRVFELVALKPGMSVLSSPSRPVRRPEAPFFPRL